MDRIRHIVHEGKGVIIFDFSNMTSGPDALKLIQRSMDECKKHPPDSILSITDVTDAVYNRDTLEGMKQFSEKSKEFTKKSAVVGITGMKKVGYRIVMAFSKRNLRVFDKVEEALDYLVKE